MDMEFLVEVKSLRQTDNYTVFKLVTNKDTYITRLPCQVTQRECGNDIVSYSFNLRDWCKARNIKMRVYLSTY